MSGKFTEMGMGHYAKDDWKKKDKKTACREN